MSPIAAGLLLDAIAILCLTVLAVSKTMPGATVLPIMSMILAARFSAGVRNALTAAIPGSGSGPDNSGGIRSSSPGLTPPAAERRSLERGKLSLARQILEASGVAVLLVMVPVGLMAIAKRHMSGFTILFIGFAASAVAVACSATGSIAGAVTKLGCLLIPLLIATPEGSVVAGTVCKDAAPFVEPVVTAVVNAATPAKRAAFAKRAASSASYAPMRLDGSDCGTLDRDIIDVGRSRGTWTIGRDGAAELTARDGGTK